MDYWVRDKIPLPNFQNRWIKFPSIGNSKKFAQNLDTDIAAMVFWNTHKGIGRLKIKYHIDGRMECQPMDKADRRRMYADLFGWRMAARFWIPKPLHSIANPSRRNLSCRSWCSVAAFHLSKSQEKTNPERRCRDIGFSFRRVRQALRMPLHRKQGSRKVARLFGKRRSSEVSDFPCLHGNERYRTCDDASTEIASIGLCQPQSRPHKTSGRNLLRGQPLNTPKKEK